MAAPVSSKSDCWKAPEVYKHHEQRKICISRPKYREGRKSKAVKVQIYFSFVIDGKSRNMLQADYVTTKYKERIKPS